MPDKMCACGKPAIRGRTVCEGCRSRARRASEKRTLAKWPSVEAFDQEDPRADARRESDFEPLELADFDDEFATAVGNDHSGKSAKVSAEAAREKRQEFTRQMGEFAQDLRSATVQAVDSDTPISDSLPERHSAYIRALAEQERRFGNRRWARSISLPRPTSSSPARA